MMNTVFHFRFKGSMFVKNSFKYFFEDSHVLFDIYDYNESVFSNHFFTDLYSNFSYIEIGNCNTKLIISYLAFHLEELSAFS